MPFSQEFVHWCQFNEIPTSCYFEKHFKITLHLRLSVPIGIIPSRSHTKNLHSFRFPPMRGTCPAHLILLDLIILIVFGKRVQIMKLPNIQLSPTTYNFIF
jgi:hypothetical protein